MAILLFFTASPIRLLKRDLVEVAHGVAVEAPLSQKVDALRLFEVAKGGDIEVCRRLFLEIHDADGGAVVRVVVEALGGIDAPAFENGALDIAVVSAVKGVLDVLLREHHPTDAESILPWLIHTLFRGCRRPRRGGR